MISKLGVVLLLKIRDWPEHWMPVSKIPFGIQLVKWLIESRYLFCINADYDEQPAAVRITSKGANAIADNMEWLMARGYKV